MREVEVRTETQDPRKTKYVHKHLRGGTDIPEEGEGERERDRGAL
jgi:hypothetical protein